MGGITDSQTLSLSLSSYDIRATTAVMLLMDPEHLTAANARKRCLVKDLDALPDSRRHDIIRLVIQELYFVDNLLTSPLHRHAKSPVIWSHRRWIVKEHARRELFLCPAGVRNTLCEVVMVAGERHGRNYHAWSHARWLVRQVTRPEAACVAGTGIDHDNEAETKERELVFDEIVCRVKAWCCRHHGDISGWSFLLFLLGNGAGPGGGSAELTRRMRQEVSELAGSMQWKNESVVWFLDMATKQVAVAAAAASNVSDD